MWVWSDTGSPEASVICSSFRKLTVCDGTVRPVTALDAAALMPMLLPSWMDPDELIKSFGPYALWGVAFIVFAECGLFAILPGDSLLFTVGLLTATGVIRTTWRSSASC